MNSALIVALIGAAGAVIGALTTLFIQSRRLPSDIRLVNAQAEKTTQEAANILIDNLSEEIARLKQKVLDLETRVSKSEERATGAEVRLADSESRASEFRRAVIAVGERLDAERKKNRDMATQLVGIIEHLLDCIEHPEQASSIDRPAIARLTQAILDEHRGEEFIGI